MLISSLIAVALMSASCAVSGADIPSETPSDNSRLPDLDGVDKESLEKLFQYAIKLKTVADFSRWKIPVTDPHITKLGFKFGPAAFNKLQQTPGQPVSVITAFLKGIWECRGKSVNEALECGEASVRSRTRGQYFYQGTGAVQ